MSETVEQFPIGITGELSIQVTPQVTAKHLGSGAVEVFATPEMVRLMEKAAVAALKPYLQPGQQTVGVAIDVRHLAATPVGAMVTAHAELIAVDRRRMTFRVRAEDGVETIGEGIHERALIDLERFEARVQAKHATIAAQQGAS